jgi:hypothetical protein
MHCLLLLAPLVAVVLVVVVACSSLVALWLSVVCSPWNPSKLVTSCRLIRSRSSFATTALVYVVVVGGSCPERG